MPLDKHLPQIDDRRYEDILAEMRTRIARYTPEWTPVWTDVNDSDPGITMMQVFAWLAEMLTYRMNQVPALNYLKFLQLLGTELLPAQSARTEITFPVKSDFTAPVVLIRERTQVSGEAPDGGAPVVFETDRALHALRARLTDVLAYDGFSFTPVTTENTTAVQGFAPFGPRATDGSALLLGFTDTGDFPQVELNLVVFIPQETTQVTAFACGLPQSPTYGPALLRWEYWSGSPGGWRSLNLLKDDTRALTRSGHVYLKTPAVGALQRGVFGPVVEPRYWIRVRVERGQYERAPHLLAVRTNTVGAVQAETIQDEVLGGANGGRHQEFPLANTPVLPDRLQIEVDQGSGFEPWTRVDDLFGSGAADHHYMLNPTTGVVRFGDGEHGAIPTGNINNPGANVVARMYRFGGGARGNLPAKVIKTPLTAINGVDDGKVENLLPSHSGREEETLREAKLRAPGAIKSRCRAVTADDFEYFAKQAATIKRARALPLFHPDFPGVKVPGVVTVIVVPDSDAPNPVPSEGTLRTVCAYLDQRRLLTTEVYVIKPTYQQVEIRGDVVVTDDADLAEVKQAIESSLLTYFHPLTGGDDGQGWPFGGTIFFSRVYQRVLAVTGVQSIVRLVIVVDGEEMSECKDVPIQEQALLYSTNHALQVDAAVSE